VVVIRRALRCDVPAIARLHASRIAEGYLSSLGLRFLARLYGRIVESPDAFAHVAIEDGRVVGFSACAVDVRALYRAFVVRDGLPAGLAAAPRLLRSLPRVWETLRYPAATSSLPEAEILAVAVAADATGRGVGRELVDANTRSLRERDVRAVKVVTGADNRAALAMYAKCGFEVAERLEVHGGVPSVVLVRQRHSAPAARSEATK
jgi:ribosomal protein S18 acetylase RimI-like enzyme